MNCVRIAKSSEYEKLKCTFRGRLLNFQCTLNRVLEFCDMPVYADCTEYNSNTPGETVIPLSLTNQCH